jgi:hypothetical protein
VVRRIPADDETPSVGILAHITKSGKPCLVGTLM